MIKAPYGILSFSGLVFWFSLAKCLINVLTISWNPSHVMGLFFFFNDYKILLESGMCVSVTPPKKKTYLLKIQKQVLVFFFFRSQSRLLHSLALVGWLVCSHHD